MAGLTRYNNSDKVIDTQKVVTSTWSDNTNDCKIYFDFTSSVSSDSDITSSAAFYREIYNNASATETQFSIAYGNKFGSGSKHFTDAEGSKNNSATRVIYNQYRQLVYGDEASDFNFNGVTSNEIFVINVNRARYKHNLKPGSLKLVLAKSGTAALDSIQLTDDSVTKLGAATITNAGRQFNLVSGSLGVMSGSSLNQTLNGTSGSYGFFYPDSGFIILNAHALSASLSILNTGSVTTQHSTNNNLNSFMTSISGGNSFILDSEEKVTSQYFFTRVKNNEYNYTTNPSFIDTNGNLNFTSMVDNPKTFITTIGLYNDSNDLVAVAKVSQPIAKDFSKEALMRVKLDY